MNAVECPPVIDSNDVVLDSNGVEHVELISQHLWIDEDSIISRVKEVELLVLAFVIWAPNEARRVAVAVVLLSLEDNDDLSVPLFYQQKVTDPLHHFVSYLISCAHTHRTCCHENS